MNYRYFLAIVTLLTVIAIACILRPNLPVPRLADLNTSRTRKSEAGVSEALESTGNCDRTGEGSSMADSSGGQNLLVSYGTLVMPTPLTLPENYYQAQGKVLDWRKHHGFWIP